MRNEQSTRSEFLAMSLATCTTCLGTALCIDGKVCAVGSVCPCVWRAIFRECYQRFLDIESGGEFVKPVDWSNIGSGPTGYRVFGRRQEEYSADFVLIAKRTLTKPLHYAVFRYHYLFAAPWDACCKRLNISRGNFFHACYQVEARCGKAYRETKPYGLHPLPAYFHGVVRGRRIPATTVDEPAPPVLPLRPPLATRGQGLAFIRERLAEAA